MASIILCSLWNSAKIFDIVEVSQYQFHVQRLCVPLQIIYICEFFDSNHFLVNQATFYTDLQVKKGKVASSNSFLLDLSFVNFHIVANFECSVVGRYLVISCYFICRVLKPYSSCSSWNWGRRSASQTNIQLLSVIHQRYQTSLEVCMFCDLIILDFSSTRNLLKDGHHHLLHTLCHASKLYWRLWSPIQWSRICVRKYCLESKFIPVEFQNIVLLASQTGWGAISAVIRDESYFHGHNPLNQTFIGC